MKKLRFFKSLFLFLLGITTAAAQEKVEPNKFETTTIEGGQFKNPKWYLVSMNQDIPGYGHAKGYMIAIDSDNEISVPENKSKVNPMDDKQLWCFVKTQDGNYQIYNKAKGATKCVTYSTSTSNKNGLAKFAAPTTEPNKSTWILTETSVQDFKGKGGFCFKMKDTSTDKQYLNKQSGKLSFWNAADNGSTFFVTTQSEAVNSQLAEAVAKGDQYQIGEGLGKYTDPSGKFNTALQAVKDAQTSSDKTAEQKLQLVTDLNNAIAQLTINQPEVGKFYSFKGSRNHYMSATTTQNKSNFGGDCPVLTDNQDEAVFYLTADKKLITSNALCVSQVTVVADLGQATTFKASVVSPGKYAICNGGKAFSDYNKNVNDGIDRRGEGDGPRYTDCAWTIEEITDQSKWSKITKNLSSANFATLAAPVALTIPEGVKAYTVEANEGKAVLTEVNTTIPAGTAVLLEKTGSESNFSFNFAASADAVESTNHLHGVYKAKEIPEGSYILANGNSGIGFYKVKASERNLAANKAYLTVSAAQANLQSIIIGGNTTGIDEIVTGETAKEIYFDLQGRRVQNPTKGIYVTKSGKKVIFN